MTLISFSLHKQTNSCHGCQNQNVASPPRRHCTMQMKYKFSLLCIARRFYSNQYNFLHIVTVKNPHVWPTSRCLDADFSGFKKLHFTVIRATKQNLCLSFFLSFLLSKTINSVDACDTKFCLYALRGAFYQRREICGCVEGFLYDSEQPAP